MRKNLGILLVEDDKGEVSVQLFADPGRAKEEFLQLNGSNKIRATFIIVDWQGKMVECIAKELPVEIGGEKADGWKVGSGPIFFVKGIQGGT